MPAATVPALRRKPPRPLVGARGLCGWGAGWSFQDGGRSIALTSLPASQEGDRRAGDLPGLLQSLYALLGGLQSLVGQDRVLDEQIGRVRVRADRTADHRVSVRVLGGAAALVQVGQELLQHIAFFGRHGASLI